MLPTGPVPLIGQSSQAAQQQALNMLRLQVASGFAAQLAVVDYSMGRNKMLADLDSRLISPDENGRAEISISPEHVAQTAAQYADALLLELGVIKRV